MGDKLITKYLKPPSNFQYYTDLIKRFSSNSVQTLRKCNDFYQCKATVLRDMCVFRQLYSELIKMMKMIYPTVDPYRLCIISFTINNNTFTFYAHLDPLSNNHPKNIIINHYRTVSVYSYIGEVTINENIEQVIEEITYREWKI